MWLSYILPFLLFHWHFKYHFPVFFLMVEWYKPGKQNSPTFTFHSKTDSTFNLGNLNLHLPPPFSKLDQYESLHHVPLLEPKSLNLSPCLLQEIFLIRTHIRSIFYIQKGTDMSSKKNQKIWDAFLRRWIEHFTCRLNVAKPSKHSRNMLPSIYS